MLAFSYTVDRENSSLKKLHGIKVWRILILKTESIVCTSTKELR